MQLRNKKSGFSFVELVVVIAILAVLLAVLSPMLISSVEHSRMQRDDSAMDEVVNAVHLAITDDKVFDEAYGYCISNNYMTYTDSSGVYGNRTVDEEFWAPDGSGPAVTITFNPDENGNYDIGKGIVNDMTYGNGSVAEKRTADGDLKQCYFEEMGNQLLYSAVKQSIGNTISEKSATYKNSSYTVFIRYYLVDGTRKADVYGAFNGTNLSEDCPAAIGSNTSSYDAEEKPISTTPSGGRQNSNYTNSDLSGGGNLPSYKNPSSEDDENSLDDGYNHNAPELHPTDAILIRNGTQTEEGAEPQKNDSYTYGDYRYKYSTNNNGWSVEVITRQKTEYGPILESINGKPIVALGNTFACCTNLTTAPVIPSGVTNMYYTFWACTSLTTAPIIPYGVTNLDSTFSDCISLTTIPVFPDSITGMTYTFKGCTSLITAPTLPNSVTSMSYTFWQCTSLVNVPKIPDGVTNMNCTFAYCSALKNAPEIPNGVTNMSQTFYKCTSLTTAPKIPNSVTDIGSAFAYCTSLTTAPDIPNSVTTMNNAFESCTALTTAPAIPNRITWITNAFKDCTSLTKAPTLPNSARVISGIFSGCTSLKTYSGSIDPDGDFSNYRIPSSVVNMENTFKGCASLTNAPNMNNATSIITLTSTFSDCISLTGTITINTNPTYYNNCFYGTTQPITITGSSTMLETLAATSSKGNVTVG